MNKIVKNQPHKKLFENIKSLLHEARSAVARNINTAMVQAYWHIGRVIVEEEQQGRAKAGYGDELISELSGRLTAEFGRGFTQTNLRYMRLFYFSFENLNSLRSQSSSVIHHAVRDESLPRRKGHALRDELPIIRPELSWTHYRLLMSVEKESARQFYLRGII
ncbi:MAG: DUF1016 N-terminal domain-containing protein [Nitrospirota bacterium]